MKILAINVIILGYNGEKLVSQLSISFLVPSTDQNYIKGVQVHMNKHYLKQTG